MTDQLSGWIDGIKSSFTSLNGSPRDLWLIFSVKFLESLAYFSKSLVFAILLSEPKPRGFGLSDYEAGVYYGIVGSLTTLYGLIVGPMIDMLGCRTSILLGGSLSLFARVAIAFTTTTWVLWINAFVVMPIGGCLMIPVMTLAVKGYTNPSNRGFAFGLFYSVMNIGALGSGLMVDALTLSMGDTLVMGLSPSRWVFVVGAICTVITLLITALLLKDTRAISQHAGSDAISTKDNVKQIVKELLRMKTFWRFVAFTLITVNLKSIFRHLDATLPKYLMREHGNDVPKGTIYSINPFMIIFLVPAVSALTSRYDHFTMIHVGSYVSALSVFILAVSTSIPAAVLFVVLLSLGEALWSPRFYDYTVSVAPEGKEGTFMAMSSAPLFVATLPTGMLSGYLLEQYCPEKGPRDSKMMWFIIALVTFTSPLLITLTQRWVREPKVAKDKGHSDGGSDVEMCDVSAEVNRGDDIDDGESFVDGFREGDAEEENRTMLAHDGLSHVQREPKVGSGSHET